jgi:disease resistance protein RPM1
MSVVTGALGSLAPKLLQLLHGEYKFQKGKRKQVESLSRELDSIYPFLQKVSDVPWDRLDDQVKVWAREVREASYI